MGNKPSVSEGEDDEDRPPFVPKSLKPLSSNELTNGGGEDVDDEVELPPPMKPIQEPILVTGPPNVPGVLPIEEDPRKRVSDREDFGRALFSACCVTAFRKHAKDVTQLNKLVFSVGSQLQMFHKQFIQNILHAFASVRRLRKENNGNVTLRDKVFVRRRTMYVSHENDDCLCGQISGHRNLQKRSIF